MATTRLGPIGAPITAGSIPSKAEEGLPPYGLHIGEFDTWRPGYAGASVLAVREGTNEHARLFSDPGLTRPIPNPQVLLSYTDDNGTEYGKWRQPVYTPHAVYLTINEANATGVTRPPLFFLAEQDASLMRATSALGTRARLIEAVLDDAIVALNFGNLSESNGAEANKATLDAAIGAAAARGGGDVMLPPGRIPFTHLTLPTSVRLRGQHMGATFLTSTFAGVAVTLGGDGAGLVDLTLDGISLVPGSVGVQGVGVVAPVFEHVTVKRFALGVRFRGVTDAQWTILYVSNCVHGMDLRGDTDVSGGGDGGPVRGVSWLGGGVNLCTTTGLSLTFFDALTENVRLSGVAIAGNIGDALLLSGARNVLLDGPFRLQAAEGQRAVKIQDDSNLALRALNTTDHITFRGGIFDGGELLFNGTCASVVFERSDFRAVSFNLTVPEEVIVLDNCIEDADTTATGDTTKLMRSFQADDRQVVGNTADAVPTVAWSKTLEPGEVGFFQAEVVAQQQDGTKYGFWWVAAGAARPGGTLNFNLQTANFTAGLIVTAATSGATARITAVTQSAGSGTLTLIDIDGTFINGEAITDPDGGDARVDGALVTASAALDGGGNTDVRAAQVGGSAAYDAYWEVSAAKVRLMVVGDTSEFVQWTARIRELVS
jgi:hypothetical protein